MGTPPPVLGIGTQLAPLVVSAQQPSHRLDISRQDQQALPCVLLRMCHLASFSMGFFRHSRSRALSCTLVRQRDSMGISAQRSHMAWPPCILHLAYQDTSSAALNGSELSTLDGSACYQGRNS